MEHRFLLPYESLQGLVQRVRESSGRPSFVIGGAYALGPDCIYRRPGEKQYVRMTDLQLFLSTWETGPFAGRLDLVVGSLRKFDLTASPGLYIAVPVASIRETHDVPDFFKPVGLRRSINPHRTAFLSNEDNVPTELKPYVGNYRHKLGREKQPGIRFLISEMIEAPYEVRPEWHYGVRSNAPNTRDSAVVLQAPGLYSGRELFSVTEVNRTMLIDTAPGPCICCHGESGVSRHIAFVQSAGSTAYPAGHICGACFPRAAEQWMRLLKEWNLE